MSSSAEPPATAAVGSGEVAADPFSSAPRVSSHRRRGGTRGRFRGAAAAAGCLVVLAAVRILVFQPTVVTSGSMEPTIDAGAVVWVNALAPRLGPAEPGSLVAARLDDGTTVVKRLMATEGQTVEIYGGALRIDGRELDEPYADNTDMGGIFFGPVRVPERQVFLLGDNRLDSIDSRVFGSLDESAVQGTVVVVLPRLF
ncbi:signal peptidase I [Microbacteriaceae bacterium 4G12]